MKDKAVLIINANRSEMETLARELEAAGHTAVGATSLDELDSAIQELESIKLILLDLTGFDEGIWDRCDRVCQDKVPYIVITSQRSPATQRDSMKHGASGLLVKPLSTKELLDHIHAVLGD